MKKTFITLALTMAAITVAPAHAISAKYREQLERSGCTQVTEAQGCDINKSKEWNSKHGFSAQQAPKKSAQDYTSFAGDYTAKFSNGQKVATIIIPPDDINLNGHSVTGQVKSGKLVIRDQNVTYTLDSKRGGRWEDRDAGNAGRIVTGIQ